MTASDRQPRTQADRRARTRDALLEAAARGISSHGYSALGLEQVASEAGYSRGALYHQFAGKEELALAVVRWIDETWAAEVAQPSLAEATPTDTLLTIARRHAVYCRRDVARVMNVLHVEFGGREHPVGRAVEEIVERLMVWCTDLIVAGRADGSLPAGPPPRETADVFLSVVEAVGVTVAGRTPHDVELMERAVRGVLGLPPKTSGDQEEP
jgi:AcrR family transcriptional regulator